MIRSAELQPDLVGQGNILGPQSRRVRTQVDKCRLAVGADDFESEGMFFARLALPGQADAARQLVGFHARADARDQL
jgi:hypothetical protein